MDNSNTSATHGPVKHKPSKASKQVAKLYAKQAQRKIKTGQLPSPTHGISIESYTSFVAHLRSSTRVGALIGAGLSAASGIPTFRGPGGFWRQYNASDLSTPEAFAKDPSLVWQFFEIRRQAAGNAKPNRAHYALAKLGQAKPGFLAITQNIDGLSERAGHPETSLQRVHGSLHRVKCSNKECTYKRELKIGEAMLPHGDDTDAADSDIALHKIPESELPNCPECSSLLRPDVVWFGEPLERIHVDRIHAWLDEVSKVDLFLVIGTSAVVFPAAAYIHAARVQGARIAVFDVEPPSEESQENPITRLRDGVDWFFEGSASETVPDVLKEVIGVVKEMEVETYERS